MPTPEDDAKEKKLKWTFNETTGKVQCCTADTSSCTVSKLLDVGVLTSKHDAQLKGATREINAILDGIRTSNKDPERHLCLIQIKDRHFLVWSHHGLVGPDDDDDVVRKMLRLETY